VEINGMRHGLMYQGGFERNFPELKPGNKNFQGSDGTERQLPDWPKEIDGLRIGYMEKPGKNFVAVRVQFDDRDICLEHPVPIDAARHMGYGQRFSPEPTVIPEETARVLLTDIMTKNLGQIDELQPIIDQIPAGGRRKFE
jgi:hypothetical protein